MKKLPISIIMSTYNDAKLLPRAIKSVQNQSFKDWEFIIIDDASTDKTKKVLTEMSKKDKRIKIIFNKVNQGLTINLNKGIKHSLGEYIARIDSDDEWVNPKKLQKQYEFLEKHKQYGLVGTFANAVDTNGVRHFVLNYPYKDNEIKRVLLKHNCFIHSSLLIRSNILKKVGGYNENFRFAQDFDLCLRIGKAAKIANIPEQLTNYTLNQHGTSIKKYKQQIKDTINIIKQYKNDYPYFYRSLLLWNLRKYYPLWLRGKTSRIIKDLFKINQFNKI